MKTNAVEYNTFEHMADETFETMWDTTRWTLLHSEWVYDSDILMMYCEHVLCHEDGNIYAKVTEYRRQSEMDCEGHSGFAVNWWDAIQSVWKPENIISNDAKLSTCRFFACAEHARLHAYLNR